MIPLAGLNACPATPRKKQGARRTSRSADALAARTCAAVSRTAARQRVRTVRTHGALRDDLM
jgi:hypothetical protein